MIKTRTNLAALGFVLFATAFTPSAKADVWNKMTVITTHESVQIKGKVLEPGRYVIKLLESNSDRRVLEVYNASGRKLEMTILASPAYRVQPTTDTRFTFSESPNGQALATWFYPGETAGLEFSVVR